MHEPLGLILVLLCALAIYFAPTEVARQRHHPQIAAIFVLNLLLGWTLLGWVGAMVWAWTAVPDAPPWWAVVGPGALLYRRSGSSPRRQVVPPPLSPAQRLALSEAIPRVPGRGRHAHRTSGEEHQQ